MRKWLLFASLIWCVGLIFSCGGPPPICDENKLCSGGKNCVENVCVCPLPQVDCKGSCTILATDNKNCGACGTKCAEGKSCVSGKCECAQGLTDCGTCVDPQANAEHCGKCGNKCKNGNFCVDGECKAKCPKSTPENCSNSCVNFQSNNQHCGKCDTACAGGKTCFRGNCECPGGKLDCSGSCINPKSSNNHCGACGNKCAAGKFCNNGKCTTDCPKTHPDVCFGGCFNKKDSNQHCGTCGTACTGGKRCVNGTCECLSGRLDCGGTCIDPRISRSNCGVCGNQCPSGKVCAEGRCVTTCPKKTESICFGGCLDTTNHPENCGGCGKACRAGELCKNSVCGCPKGQVECDKQCVDIKLNISHCGACKKSCNSGESCADGKCVTSCPSSTPTDCSGSCVDTKKNIRNCGGCGIVCAQGQACSGGKCTCPKGLLLCNGVCVDPIKDPLNCGKCNVKCPARNKCVNVKGKGVCQLDCSSESLNTQCQNQCVDVNTDIRHCGQCQNACTGLKGCLKGKCVCPTKPTVLNDCKGACVNLQSDVKNCGKCGEACKAGFKCNAGKCELDCLKSETVCGSSCVDLQNNDKHCGKCGNTCPTGQFCSKGTCVCPPNYTYCDGKCVDTQFTSEHCGACKNACKTGSLCNKGKCTVCSSASQGVACGATCCPTAFGCCGTTKACVDIRINNQHCGKCGNACAVRELCCGSGCVKALSDVNHCGACGRKCASNQSCCNGQCADYKNDPQNCGGCGRKCGAGQVCCGGQCANLKSSTTHCGKCGTSCGSGQTCCNGVCASLTTSASNCGLCGKACGSGESCCNGRCFNLNTSTTHCKTCGNACSLGGQTGLSGCCGGACVNLFTDVKNCGRCGTSCPANSSCCSGGCANLQTNRLNCGSCGKQCNSSESCCAGGCANLNTDAKNCGSCGTACASGRSCCGRSCKDLKKDVKNCGTCGKSCSTGESCCGGGCADLQFNSKNCGACGNACSAGNRCHLGKCVKCHPSAREICGNKIDDDCDGKTDEADSCQSTNTSSSIYDYQRLSDGSSFVVHYPSGRSLYASCYKPDGSVKVARFTVYNTGYRQESPAVFTSRRTGISVVTWVGWSSSSSSSRRVYFRVYDKDCKAVSTGAAISIAQSSNYVYDAAIDQDGNFVIAAKTPTGQISLVFYNKSGQVLGSPLLVDKAKVCTRGTPYGFHVAVNAAGDGVVSCQGHQSNPIYFQRFSRNRTLIGTAMIKIPETESSKSSWYQSHALGINDRGEFVIQWQNGTARTDEALFYSASGTKVKHLVLGPVVAYYYEGFEWTHQKVEIYDNDFILRQTPRTDRGTYSWYRYDKAGKLISTVSATDYRRFLTRVWMPPTGCTGSNCKSVACAVFNNTIRCGGFDFSPGIGMCGSTACACQPYEGRQCYDGGPATSYVRLPCKKGQQYCKADGSAWSTCAGQVTPTAEACGNKKDDDCDGSVDESCSTSNEFNTINVIAMDAFRSGGLVTVHWNGAMLRGSCFNPDTSIKAGAFNVTEQQTRSVALVSVRVSQSSNKFVVSWIETRSGNGNDYVYYSRLFDGNCKPITRPMAHLKEKSGRGRLDAAIDDTGNFVVVLRHQKDSYGVRMYFYDAQGKLMKGDVIPDATYRFCEKRANFGVRVALNPTTGDGVVTCQSREYRPIYYRRFKAGGSFVDQAMVMVKDTDQNGSGRYDTHITGMNRKGAFVIEWLSQKTSLYQAHFYDSSAKIVKSVALGSDYDSRYDVFYGPHSIKLIGDDFVLFTGDRSNKRRFPGRWLRYSPSGAIVSVGLGKTNQERDFFALGGANIFLLRTDRRTVDVNPFSLAPGQGLCSGKPCVCTPNTTRDCYNGSTSTGTPRKPCLRGKQTCAANGLSWSSCAGEVLPSAEKCGDRVDNDCDGSVDEYCPSSSFVETAYRSISDYDVAEDGRFVTVTWNGQALVGSCYNSNLSVKKGSFLISASGKYTQFQTVKMSRNGLYFLVTWREAPSSSASAYVMMSRLYDANCSPISAPFAWFTTPSTEYHFDTAVANSGAFAVLWKEQTGKVMWFRYYNNKGKQVGQDQKVSPSTTKCQGVSYAIRLAMNPVSGNGIVTCQRHASDPIFYRLFSTTGALVGSDMIEVANTRGKSAWYESHVVGMNKKSQFVITWQDYRRRYHAANFYSASGRLLKYVDKVGNANTSSSYYDGFRTVHATVELVGDDFVIRDGGRLNYPLTWYRYSPTGSLVSKAVNPNSSYERNSMRYGNNAIYLHNRSRVYKSLIQFK